MIAWLNPIGFVALAGIGVPIVIHLLLRHRAVRVVIPTVRFVPVRHANAVRVRRPSDLWLLLIRAGILGCAALAVAGPLALTEARRAAWEERTARVVIVELTGASERPALAEALRVEQSGADPYRRIDTTDVASVLGTASGWLEVSPPARREIVVVSPFVHGSMSEAALTRVPAGIGLRFVRAPHESSLQPVRARIVSGGDVQTVEARASGAFTQVRYDASGRPTWDGLTIAAGPEDAVDIERVRRALGRLGVTAPRLDRPLVVSFRGARSAQSASPDAKDPARAAAGLRLLQDPAVADLPFAVNASGPLLQVEADLDVGSGEAVTLIRAALDARAEPPSPARHEPVLIADEMLKAWSRPAAPPSDQAWRQSDVTDARWFWLGALILLGLEGIVRTRQTRREAEASPHAA